jgi:hypothetical protein
MELNDMISISIGADKCKDNIFSCIFVIKLVKRIKVSGENMTTPRLK